MTGPAVRERSGRAGRTPASRFDLRTPRSARWTLRAQLITWNILALAILLGVLGALTRYLVGTMLMASVRSRLESEAMIAPPMMFRGGPGHHGGPDGPDDHGDRRMHGGPMSDHGPMGPGGDMFGGGFGGPDNRSSNSPMGFPPSGSPDDSTQHRGDPRDRGNDFGGPANGYGGQRHSEGPAGMPDGIPEPPSEVEIVKESAGASHSYPVRHFDLEGRGFGNRQMLDRHGFVVVRNRAQTDASGFFECLNIDGEPVEVLSVPYRMYGETVAIAQAGYPLKEINQALAGLDSALLTLIPVGLLFAGAGGGYLTTRVLKRVRQTAQAAESIGVNREGSLSARLPVTGNDEFAALATTFNDLLGRLDSAFQQQGRLLEQQRRFTADASHELKTPLTVVQGISSMMQETQASPETSRDAFGKINRASAMMSHLVQDLLLLARSDSGQLGRGRIELLVRDLAGQAVAAVSQRPGPAVEIDIPDETLIVPGAEIELVRVLSNLLDNALRHTPETGAVRIAAARAGSDWIEITVKDTGSGIPPEHLPHLGERFYRVDTARARSEGGTGLGLSISRSIVEAHGGSLEIESVYGAGTTVRVLLPSPQEPAGTEAE